jgi:hypothetical protein
LIQRHQLMTAPKRFEPRQRSRLATIPGNLIGDLETQRWLRKDLKLTDENIAGIDLDWAIEAGLLSQPRSRRR